MILVNVFWVSECSHWNVWTIYCHEKLTKERELNFLSASGLHVPFSIITCMEWMDVWKFNDYYALYLDFYFVYLLSWKNISRNGWEFIAKPVIRFILYRCSKPFIKMQRIAMLYDIFEFEKGYNDINDK